MGLIIAVVAICALIFPFYVLSQLSIHRQEIDQLKRLMGTNQAASGSIKAPQTSIYGSAYTDAITALEQKSADVPSAIQSTASQPTLVTPPPPVIIPTTEPASWIAEDTFMKVGAFLILLAAGWFVSYAFSNNWIGPVGRISIGILFGLSVMGVGVWRAYTNTAQGAVLVALGMSITLVTCYAARFVYDFFTPSTALLVMFIVVALTAAVSIRFKVEALAIIALCGGAAAPILAHVATPDVLGLHTYLGVLFAGSLLVAAILPAPSLVLVALGVAALYGSPYIMATGLELSVARIAAMIYAIAFLSFSTVAMMRTKESNQHLYLVTSLATGMYVAGWIVFTVSPAMQGIVSLLWAGGFLFAAALLWSLPINRTGAYVQAGMAIAFLALATAYYLDGALLTVAYLMQVTTLVLIALYQLKDVSLASSLSWLYGGVVFLSLPHFIASSWNTGVWHFDFLIPACVAVTLFGVGIALARAGDDTKTDAVLITTAAMYAGTLMWLVTHTLLGDQVGTAVSLIMYTIVGLTLYVAGQRTSDEYARVLGGAIIVGVIIRLFLVDVWELELIYRIIAFFVVGILLVTTAFVKRQHPEK